MPGYTRLWDMDIAENPQLLTVLRKASELSDMFGKPGHCCQATELWRIRACALANAGQVPAPVHRPGKRKSHP